MSFATGTSTYQEQKPSTDDAGIGSNTAIYIVAGVVCTFLIVCHACSRARASARRAFSTFTEERSHVLCQIVLRRLDLESLPTECNGPQEDDQSHVHVVKSHIFLQNQQSPQIFEILSEFATDTDEDFPIQPPGPNQEFSTDFT